MVLECGVFVGRKVSFVKSDTLLFIINRYLSLSGDYLDFTADVLVRDTVVMFVLPQLDMAVFHHFLPPILFVLIALDRQG